MRNTKRSTESAGVDSSASFHLDSSSRPGLLARLRNWYESLFSPELDWIQIEVSSCCNSSCLYCPHTVLGDSWENRHMSAATFKKLLPAIGQTGLVHLQGWGEPLMNPDLPAMVRLAKKAGACVGTTTNGILLDESMTDRLLEAGIDIISLSLAGVHARNDTLRSGTHFDHISDALTLIDTKRRQSRSETPKLHVAYLLLRSAADDLRLLPTALEGKGVDEIIVSTLDLVPTPRLTDETIWPANESEYEDWRSLLEEARKDAEERGMTLHYYLRHPGKRRSVCTENPQSALFVSADGSVSPCVFTALPVTSGSSGDIEGLPEQLTFGNINQTSLAQIWQSREYVEFRRTFDGGRPASPCKDCPKLYMVDV